jgi:hypothetical protein
MPRPSLLLPFLFITHLATAQSQLLFKVSQYGKTGYINNKGTIVIPAIYHNGFEFAEGLAAVRENGLYGFIDSSGKYAIAPQYDYATYFVNGITLVYKERQPYFIDRTGKVILPPVYQSMKFITTRKAVITTKAGKTGIIDVPTGRLLLDTLYGLIEFDKGVGVIGQYDSSRIYYSRRPQAVIDTACNFIVPFGKFDNILPFHDGYARVSIDLDNNVDGVIDSTGRLLKRRTATNTWNITGEFHENRAKIYYYYGPEYSYEGFIDLAGDTILSDAKYVQLHDFSCGRAIALTRDGKYFVLDRNGKKVGNRSFNHVNDKFVNNYAIASTDKHCGIIDTNARYVVPPKYNMISFPDSSVDYFFFSVPNNKKKYSDLYGVASITNKVIIQPIMEDFEKRGFTNGLLSATVNNRKTCFNKQGKIVWQEPVDDEHVIRSVNIDYIGYSAYRVSTEPEDSIRWESSSPGYKKITAANRFNNNEFIFQIDTSKRDTLLQKYYAWKLIVGNSTKDTINLLSISGLALQLEALDDDGEWKKIEYIGFPTHTNGYRITQLAPGTYWPLTIPRFEGSFTTKIRAALWYLDKNEKKQIIYSNTIPASINKTQFWRNWYYPEGVYDPHWYNDRVVDMSTVEKDNWGEDILRL